MKRIATFDCETPPFKFGRKDLKPFVWGYFDGDDFQYFWDDDDKVCTENFLEYIQDESDLIIYAHNGGKFDFHFLLPYLDSDIMLINGRIAKATLFGGRVEIRDSLLILPVALGQYDKDQIDYNLFEKGTRNLHKQEIIRYLRKDCESLYELCNSFLKRFGNNLTIASTALKEIRKTGYEITRTHKGYDEKMRPFYFGGRVQCFSVGAHYGSFDYVDINSAYPRAMCDHHWYGSGLVEHLRMPETDNGSWFARIKAVSKGALPFRHKELPSDKGKLYFPDDDKVREYYASGWEIKAGLETDTLKIIKVLNVYKPTMLNDFSDYILPLYEEKKTAKANGDKINELFAKLLQNSGYGKFGQDGSNFEKFVIVESGDWPENDPKWEHDQRWLPYCDLDNGYSVFKRPDPDYRYYNVATAASITGWVRAFMWKSLLASDKPLYCDTDSIICERFNGDIGPELGQWKLEAKLTEVHIAQRKMYAGRVWPVTDHGPIDETKVASKGVRLDYNEIKEAILEAKKVTFKKESPAISLSKGFRYMEKKINFENLTQNIVTNPD